MGVLTRMYYVFGEQEGAKLTGTPIMLAVTTGAVPEIVLDGWAGRVSRWTRSSRRSRRPHIAAGLPWHAPFLFHNANQLTDEMLAEARPAYQAALRRFIAATPVREAAQAA